MVAYIAENCQSAFIDIFIGGIEQLSAFHQSSPSKASFEMMFLSGVVGVGDAVAILSTGHANLEASFKVHRAGALMKQVSADETNGVLAISIWVEA